MEKNNLIKNKKPVKNRLKVSTLPLWLLSVLSILLVAFMASDEPILPIFRGTWLDSFFQQFDTGNSIIFDLSIGFLVSVIFYILVVWIPNRQRKNLIKRNFKEQYLSFKHDMIKIFLSTCQDSYDNDLPSKLSEISEFRSYFTEHVNNSQNKKYKKWDAIFNDIDEHNLKELLVEMEILMNEIAYVLNSIDINDHNVFSFFKHLSQIVYRLKNSTSEYEDKEKLFDFLWQLFAGWDIVKGCRNYDIVKVMISKI